MNYALERWDLPPVETAYGGDSGMDMAFALASGILPTAAPGGYRSMAKLLEEGAAFAPEALERFLELLQVAAVLGVIHKYPRQNRPATDLCHHLYPDTGKISTLGSVHISWIVI